MGLRSWLQNRRAAAGPFDGTDGNGTPVAQFTPSVVEFIRLGADTSSLGNLYRQLAPVRICVNLLANNIAQCKLKSYRRTEDSPESLRDEPLPRLLDRPNAYMSGYDLVHGTVADIAIYDTAYWYKRNVGNARSLFRLPPEAVMPRGGDILTGPGYYDLATSNGPKRLETSEIVDFRGYNPSDTRIGSPPLQALRSILTEEVEASRHRAAFWRKRARMGGIIERPETAPMWGEDERNRFREGLRKFTRGGELEEDLGILEDGMKYAATSFSPKDSEFIAGRDWVLDMTATVYNIPLAVLSRTATPTFASMQEFHKMLYVDTLGPWMGRIERAIWLQLLPDFGDPDLYVEFNIDEKLQGDEAQQAASARNSVQVPWLSVNEIRALRGKPRIDDPLYDVPARPSNYLYGDEPMPMPGLSVVEPGQQAALDFASNGHAVIADLEKILEDS